MGRMLGAFDNPQELDRPDLNKCPDCECYFAGENCPLCGKPCPEEMKAGNRKPPKKEKKNRSSNGRVYFVEWYHRWWFIALAMFVMPIAGIVLLITSPHKKSAKITFIAIGAAYFLISTIGIGSIIGMISGWIDPLVDTSLSREEYIAKCNGVDAEDFYRSADKYEDKFVSMTLVITGSVTDAEAYYMDEKYPEYYVCKSVGGGKFEILVRKCLQDSSKNYVVGDVITVYGEGASNTVIIDMVGNTVSAPCINVAYISLIASGN